MSLDHLKIESCNPIEEGLVGSKPRSMLRLVVQNLSDGRGCFGCHGCFLSVSFMKVNLFELYDTASCLEEQGLKPQSPDHGVKSRGLRRAQALSRQGVCKGHFLDKLDVTKRGVLCSGRRLKPSRRGFDSCKIKIRLQQQRKRLPNIRHESGSGWPYMEQIQQRRCLPLQRPKLPVCDRSG